MPPTNKTHKDYKEMYEALKPLGFIDTEKPGVFYNAMIGKDFDFGACSIHGCMYVVFQDGFWAHPSNPASKI